MIWIIFTADLRSEFIFDYLKRGTNINCFLHLYTMKHNLTERSPKGAFGWCFTFESPVSNKSESEHKI